jgi:hypothetical protein
MDNILNRRSALMAFGLTVAGAAAPPPVLAATTDAGRLLPAGATSLKRLTERLAQAPRRRDFRTVPMVLTDPTQWDHEALSEVIAYQGGPRQLWDNTNLGGPWLNGMRNALNAQIWSFKHPDFLIVSATHGTAQLPLLDQAMWDKYQLAKQTNGAYVANTLLTRKDRVEADRDFESGTGAYSGEDNGIAGLMDRGVVFLACHLGIWELVGKLRKTGINPDGLSQEAMVAELTNHLAPGVVLTPGMVATIPELQQAGYHYIV